MRLTIQRGPVGPNTANTLGSERVQGVKQVTTVAYNPAMYIHQSTANQRRDGTADTTRT